MRINNFRGQNNWKAMPLKIDLIDRKIMYLLCKNARLSNTAIGKALNLKREVVSYRIKKMQENGFLNGFMCRINPRKIGHFSHVIYLKLKTPINEKEMVENLIGLKEVTNLKNHGGRFDLRIETSTKSLPELDAVLKKILNNYHSVIQEHYVLNVLEDNFMGLDLLLDKESLQKLSSFKELKGSSFQKDIQEQIVSNDVVTLSEWDKKILSTIKMNARISLKEIAHEIKSNPSLVQQRLAKMVRQGVITHFRTLPTMSNLDYQMYPVLFNLRNLDELKFVTYLKTHPNVSWYYKFIGNWNYQVNILARNNAEFHDVINDLREKFSDNIVSFDVMMVFNSFKSEQRVD